MRRNLPLVVLCVISGIATMLAGHWYWDQKKGDFFRRLHSRQSFSLLDGEGKIFNTKEFPRDQKVVVIFTPDAIPVTAVKPFHSLVTDLAKAQGGKVGLTVVSRIHGDRVRNFLRAARFEGRLLLDPSGAFGRYLGAWPSLDPLDDWTVVLVDHDLNLSWSVARRDVPSYRDLKF